MCDRKKISLSVLAVLFSLLLQGTTLFLFLPRIGPSWSSFDKPVQVSVLLAVSMVLSLLSVTGNKIVCRTVLFIKAGILVFICKAVGTLDTVFQYFLASSVLESAFFLAPPYGLFFSVFLVAAAIVSLAPHSTDAQMIDGITLPDLVFSVIFSVVTAAMGTMLRVFQNACIVRDTEIERLESVIRRVTDTNFAYQNYAVLAEEKSVEKERQRISREIHDIIGYTMTNVLMLIQAALHSTDCAQMRLLLVKAQTHLNESVNDARLALRRLRERDIRSTKGVYLFVQLTKTFSEIAGIDIDIDFGNMTGVLGSAAEKAVYRMLQEGMTNSFRHGKATHIAISFRRENNAVTVRLLDNGNGSAGVIREGIGIRGMRERVELLGGILSAGQAADGFLIQAVIPLEDSDE